MVARQLRQPLRRLVVGRVRLEDQARLRFDEGAQRAGLLRPVVDDLVVVELDPRLHHHRDHPRPGRVQAGRGEGLAVQRQRRAGCLGRGHRQFVQVLVRAARHRHLGADDVDRRLAAVGRFAPGLLGRQAQPHRAGRDLGLGQRHRVVGAGHGAVHVDLAEAGGDVLRHHHLGLGHRLRRGQAAPGVGPEVVAAQHEQLRRQALDAGQRFDEAAEVDRRHAGVAAVLVDLVGGRLDQRRPAERGALAQRRRQHDRMRRAHRRDADGGAVGGGGDRGGEGGGDRAGGRRLPMAPHEIEHELQGRSFLSGGNAWGRGGGGERPGRDPVVRPWPRLRVGAPAAARRAAPAPRRRAWCRRARCRSSPSRPAPSAAARRR